MTCHEAEPYLMDALAGTPLSPSIKAHIEGCAACQEALAEVQQTHAMLQQALVTPPPADLRTAFYAQLSQLQAEAALPSLTWWSRLQATWRPLAMAGAFAFVFLVGYAVATVRSTAPPGPAAMLAQLQSASPAERLTAAYESLSMDEPDAAIRDALLQAMHNDPNVNVRVAAVEALAHFAGQAPVQQGVLRALLTDASPNVQMAALHVVEAERPATLETVLTHLLTRTDLEPLVRTHATTLLNMMT